MDSAIEMRAMQKHPWERDGFLPPSPVEQSSRFQFIPHYTIGKRTVWKGSSSLKFAAIPPALIIPPFPLAMHFTSAEQQNGKRLSFCTSPGQGGEGCHYQGRQGEKNRSVRAPCYKPRAAKIGKERELPWEG